LREAELSELLMECRPEMIICLEEHQDMLRHICKRRPIRIWVITKMEDWREYGKPVEVKSIPDGQIKYYLNDLLFNRLSTQDRVLPEITPNDPAIYQFSGGTTGKPKAVIGLQRNIAANVTQFRVWCHLQEGREVILAAIPLYHVYGMVLALNMGAALWGGTRAPGRSA
jgi:long-chain acyl-CoA synthetase